MNKLGMRVADLIRPTDNFDSCKDNNGLWAFTIAGQDKKFQIHCPLIMLSVFIQFTAHSPLPRWPNATHSEDIYFKFYLTF